MFHIPQGELRLNLSGAWLLRLSPLVNTFYRHLLLKLQPRSKLDYGHEGLLTYIPLKTYRKFNVDISSYSHITVVIIMMMISNTIKYLIYLILRMYQRKLAYIHASLNIVTVTK